MVRTLFAWFRKSADSPVRVRRRFRSGMMPPVLLWACIAFQDSSAFRVTFESYTDKSDINDIAIRNDSLWIATGGGVVVIDLEGKPLRYITVSEGLPGNAVKSISFAPHGAMVCLASLPAEYRGGTWRLFRKTDGLVDEAVTCLAVDSNGGYWFGTANRGFSVFDGAAWRTCDGFDGLVYDVVRGITIDPNGQAWIGTQRGVSRFDGEDFTNYTQDNWGLHNNNVTRIHVDRRVRRWFTSMPYGQGMSMFDGTAWKVYTAANGFYSNFITALAEGSDGRLYFGTGAGLAILDDTTWSLYEGRDDESFVKYLEALAVDSRNRKWMGTSSGLYLFNDTVITSVPIAPFTLKNDVYAIATCVPGQLWFGHVTGSGGVSRCTDGVWTLFTTGNSGLGEYMARCITAVSPREIWVGHVNKGVSRLVDTVWTSFTPQNSNIPGANVITLFTDRKGRVWCGTDGYGCAVYDSIGIGDSLQWLAPYTTREGLPSNRIFAISQDRDGAMWFGSDKGLSRLRNDTITVISIGDMPAGCGVHSIAFDSTSSMWLATLYGVFRCQGNQWIRSTNVLPDTMVNCVAVDRKNRVWAGTIRGLACFAEGSWRSFTYLDGLAGDGILSLAVENDSVLWVGTLSGASQLTISDDNVSVSSRTSRTSSRRGPSPIPRSVFPAMSTYYTLQGRKITDPHRLTGVYIRRDEKARHCRIIASINRDGRKQ
ncbi:MAG: hypothetical protein JXA71_00895 [Chitinispirillaceae bacterium]|nr:hypothetical protein [Chitinispirillaceae bacterium]